jgi:hypothetical protein
MLNRRSMIANTALAAGGIAAGSLLSSSAFALPSIAPRRVFAPIRGPSHFGMAAIGQHIAAQSCHLNRLMIPDRCHRAMRKARFENLASGGEQTCHDFLRRQRCRDIHIRHRQARQGITHCTTHGAAAGQGIQHLRRCRCVQEIRQ